MSKKQKKSLLRICIAAIGLVGLHLIPLSTLPKAIASIAVYLLIGFPVLKKALRGICNRRVFDENFLMALATVGAIILAFYQKSYDFTEAISVMLFYQIGELFESYAVGKSRRSISALMNIRPDYANIEQDGALVQVDPEDVAVGTLIVVQPGEKIPIDGQIVSGSSTLNTSALTGESLPREVTEGDMVISGCINRTGVLRVRVDRPYGESTVARILELVEHAGEKKAKRESFITRFARVYTPIVVALAVNISIKRSLQFALLTCQLALLLLAKTNVAKFKTVNRQCVCSKANL